jgi:pimeloyl-ACP methyl ester carboxylesterase
MTTTDLPHDHRYVVHDGVRLAFRDLGESREPPVVLLHGLFSGGRSWTDFTLRLLAAGRRVVELDQRGHGLSDKTATYTFADFEADLLAVLDHLELNRVDLVGHSLGGRVATMFAEHHPDRVRRLVVEDAPPPPVPGDRYRGPGLGSLPVRHRALLLAMLVFRYRTVRRYVDFGMALAVLREFRRPDQQWWDDLSSISAPTLVIHGGPTSHVPADRLEHMLTVLPDARLVAMDVGHRVHNNAPDAYADLVLTFLEPSMDSATETMQAGLEQST